ncbi:MAG: hypothetical protein E8D43_00465, partial [Nitrospira sp.]
MFFSPLNGIAHESKNYSRTTLMIPKGLRYAGSTLVGLTVEDPSAAFPLLSMVNGWVRPKTSDRRTVLEFEARPFEYPEARTSLGAWPTLYLAFDAEASGITEARSIDPITRVTATDIRTCSIGIARNNKNDLDIFELLTWLETVVTGLDPMPPNERRLERLMNFARMGHVEDEPIILRDARGTPLPGRDILVRIGDTVRTLTTDAGGDLLAPSSLSREQLETGTIELLGGQFARSNGTSGHGAIQIGVGTTSLTFTDLNAWFSPQQAPALERFTHGNRVTPFLNRDVFDDIFRELANISPGSTPGFHLTGYFISANDKLTELPDIPNNVRAAVEALVAAGGGARFLALDFFNIDPDTLDDVAVAMTVVLLVALLGSGVILMVVDDALLDETSVFHLLIVTAAGIYASFNINEILEKLAEPNAPAIAALNGPGSVALMDPYPAAAGDNPYLNSVPHVSLVRTVLDSVRNFNVFHQKIAVISNDAGVHAYAGGVDLNPDRLDDFEHQVRAPYKDVHARVDGPAVRDLAITFEQRWSRTAREDTPLAIVTPTLESLENPLARDRTDIVQIARTYYAPNPDPDIGTVGLGWAPRGETTIYETTLAAIRNAQDFIYIEDQYLTPPSEYIDAIIEAAGRVQGIVIMVPTTPDQPFGNGPRRAFVRDLPENVFVGVMRRGQQAIRTSRQANNGRFYLAADMSDTPVLNETIEVRPVGNVPQPPFWMVVDSEAMFVSSKHPSSDSERVVLNIRRGNSNHFFGEGSGTSPMPHLAAAAVTVVEYTGVYVHSKIMIVDDVFASIGSANVNRRGFFSDGECNIFAMPEGLRFGSRNWIRTLRKRLWAEALNIPERFSEVMLNDPIQGLKLFERKRSEGNRFVPFSSELIFPEVYAAAGGTPGPTFLGVEETALPLLAVQLIGAMTIAAEEDAV